MRRMFSKNQLEAMATTISTAIAQHKFDELKGQNLPDIADLAPDEIIALMGNPLIKYDEDVYVLSFQKETEFHYVHEYISDDPIAETAFSELIFTVEDDSVEMSEHNFDLSELPVESIRVNQEEDISESIGSLSYQLPSTSIPTQDFTEDEEIRIRNNLLAYIHAGAIMHDGFVLRLVQYAIEVGSNYETFAQFGSKNSFGLGMQVCVSINSHEYGIDIYQE